MFGNALGKIGNTKKTESLSETVETYKYSDIQNCFVSNYVNNKSGVLFVMKNGIRFKFVCVVESCDTLKVIRTINGFIDAEAKETSYRYFSSQGIQPVMPAYQQESLSQPAPADDPMPDTEPVHPAGYPQQVQNTQPMGYPQPAQNAQPMGYPQPVQNTQPMGYPQTAQNAQPMGYPQQYQQPAYPQNVPDAADKYSMYSFVMELSNFIRVDEQYIAVIGAVRKGSVTNGAVLNVISKLGLNKGSFEVRSIAVNKAISDIACEGSEDTALLCSFSPSLLKAGDIVCE